MFGDKDVMATIAVRNLKAAKSFYEKTLGLKLTEKQQEGTAAYHCGTSILLIYESTYAGTNKATSATWKAGADVEEIAKTLKAKGVTFEHYDFPGTTLNGDVHVTGTHKVAWFKDPDGNILSIVSA
ncbi:MAG TPA: VOC family protein [Thermoanaerobaculia bacterium]|jgi:catechol 2,3-dioxygenase-like lactoylglutathione lyase family enzyme